MKNSTALLVFNTFLLLLICQFHWENQLAGQTGVSTHDDLKLIDGLRRRRLFDLAESYCAEKLGDANLDPTSQASLNIELIKTLTARAVLAQPEKRNEYWQAIEKKINEFRTTSPDHPRAFLVEVQRALSHISYGQLIRQELDADMVGGSVRESAIEELRKAKSLLEGLGREVTKAIPKNRGRKLTKHELSSEQMLTLKKNIRYQLAICNLNRAQLYDMSDPANHLNRVDALNSVNGNLIEVQRETSFGEPLWWNANIAQVECFRLLEKTNDAIELLNTLPNEEVPTDNAQPLLEQRLLLAIELGNANFSQSALSQAREIAERSPKVDLAVVSLASHMALLSTDDAQKQNWLDYAAQQTTRIETTHGDYWGRRAELILIDTAGGSAENEIPAKENLLAMDNGSPNSSSGSLTSGKLNLLIRLGDQAFRKGRYVDAVKAYDQAHKVAELESNPIAGLRIQVKASQVLEKQSQHASAAHRLIESAKNSSGQTLAAAAHLRGCWNFGQTVSTETPESGENFIKHLQQHLVLWPNEPTADQARIYLARQLEHDQQWRFAFEQYLALSANRLHEVTDPIRRCSNNYLIEETKKRPSIKPLANQVIQQIETASANLAKNNSVSNQLLLTQAEIDLLYGSNRPRPRIAEQLLNIARGSEEIQFRAKVLRAVSLALSNPGESKKILIELGQEAFDMAELARCDLYLKSIAEKGSLQSQETEQVLNLRLALIENSLSALDRLAPSDLKKSVVWKIKKSNTLVSLKQFKEALLVLKELEKSLPKSSTIQMQLARTLTEIHRTKNPEKAINQWRRVSARLRPHTANWYEAKYNVAELLIQSGQKKEANKLLRYIQAIPPGWERSTRKHEFELLLNSSQ